MKRTKNRLESHIVKKIHQYHINCPAYFLSNKSSPSKFHFNCFTSQINGGKPYMSKLCHVLIVIDSYGVSRNGGRYKSL